jgi:hypothetical protein
MRELANVADEFLLAAGKLIRRARAQDPRVMAHVHFDNTEDETQLVHDCEPGTCPRCGRGHSAGRGRSGAALRPARQNTKTFREDRQQLNTLDPEVADRERGTREPAQTELVERGGRTVKRVKIGDCWYRTLDTDAGIRAYMGPHGAKRFWHGYYSGKAVCHFTGGVIPSSRAPASRSTTSSTATSTSCATGRRRAGDRHRRQGAVHPERVQEMHHPRHRGRRPPAAHR